jgi:hypothetical protein
MVPNFATNMSFIYLQKQPTNQTETADVYMAKLWTDKWPWKCSTFSSSPSRAPTLNMISIEIVVDEMPENSNTRTMINSCKINEDERPHTKQTSRELF